MAKILHDEMFAIEDAVYDEDKRTLLLPVRRQFHAGEEVVIKVECDAVTYEKSWMISEFVMQNVIALEKYRDQGLNCAVSRALTSQSSGTPR